jgi:hypothetical protein
MALRLCVFLLALANPSPFKSMESTRTKTRYRVKIKQMGEYSYEIAVPNCGKECVCCNALTTDRITARFGNSDQFHLSGPMVLPVCPDCKFHVNWRNMFWDKAFGMATAFCWLYFRVWIFAGHQILPLSWARAILVPTAFYWLYTFFISRRMGGSGHHAGIALYITNRTVHVATSNLDLVKRLIFNMERGDVTVEVKPRLKQP